MKNAPNNFEENSLIYLGGGKKQLPKYTVTHINFLHQERTLQILHYPAVTQVRGYDSYTSPTNIITLKGAETTVWSKSERQ